MKKVLLGSLLTLILAAQNAQSAEMKLWNGELETKGFDFVVPVVTDEDQVVKQVGQMFYDIGEGLKIVNPVGDVDRLSTEGSAVVSSTSGGEIIMRAQVELSGTPQIIYQSGGFATLDYTGTGNFTLEFADNLFGAAPTCTCTVEHGSAPFFCQLNDTSTPDDAKFLAYELQVNAGPVLAVTPRDIRVNVICMGVK